MSEIGYATGVSNRNNVTEFLRELAENRPAQELLRWKIGDGYQSITAVELWDTVRRTARGFSASGLSSGDRVLVFLPMSLPLYVAMFALQHLGAVPVFLDGWARRNELGASAEIAAPRGVVSFPQAFAFFADEPLLAQVPLAYAFGGDVNLPDGKLAYRLEELFRAPGFEPTCPVASEHTALITFTTGSSGRPKGADRTHRFLAAQHYALDRHLPYKADDVDLPVFPIFSLNNLAAGVVTVLPDIDLARPTAEDPARLLTQFEEQGVTCATLSPWLFRGIAALCAQSGQLLSLRRIVTGGAPVARDEVALMKQVAPQAEILVLYGSTEVEPIAHISAEQWLARPSRSDAEPDWVDPGVNVGRLDAGLRTRFLAIGIDVPPRLEDWTGFEVAPGEVGELLVSGEHVCRGYFRDEEAFRRAKVLDRDGAIWHRTGDLGYVDDSGDLWLVGRVHNAIRHRTGWQFPVRAEMVLRKLPFCVQAAYVGMPVGEAWCVVQVEAGIDPQDPSQQEKWRAAVQAICALNGIVYDRVVFVGHIPMDARHHSKVEYESLRSQLLGQESPC